MKTTTLNPIVSHFSQDVENQSVKMNIEGVPLYPASIWLKHEFKRAISIEERPFLLVRMLKYFILHRAALNPDILLLVTIGPYITNPPEINGLPIDSKVFFPIIFTIKAVISVILIACFASFTRSQRQAGIARILSLEMLDHMKLKDTVTMIAGATIYITLLSDILVLCWLRCSATDCSQVTSSNPGSSSVLNYQYTLIINFLLAILFPFIYWLFLVCKKSRSDPSRIMNKNEGQKEVETSDDIPR